MKETLRHDLTTGRVNTTGTTKWTVARVDAKERIIWIIDLDQGVSITNNAERVVRSILGWYDNHRIYYRDTDGRWDELVHDGRNFTGFAPGVAP